MTELLVTLSNVALTVICVPVVALPEIVPVPLPWVKVRTDVFELFQVTEEVMSC